MSHSTIFPQQTKVCQYYCTNKKPLVVENNRFHSLSLPLLSLSSSSRHSVAFICCYCCCLGIYTIHVIGQITIHFRRNQAHFHYPILLSLSPDAAKGGKDRFAPSANVTPDATTAPATNPTIAIATKAGVECSAIKVRLDRDGPRERSFCVLEMKMRRQ